MSAKLQLTGNAMMTEAAEAAMVINHRFPTRSERRAVLYRRELRSHEIAS
jgi:hypothetical protein